MIYPEHQDSSKSTSNTNKSCIHDAIFFIIGVLIFALSVSAMIIYILTPDGPIKQTLNLPFIGLIVNSIFISCGLCSHMQLMCRNPEDKSRIQSCGIIVAGCISFILFIWDLILIFSIRLLSEYQIVVTIITLIIYLVVHLRYIIGIKTSLIFLS